MRFGCWGEWRGREPPSIRRSPGQKGRAASQGVKRACDVLRGKAARSPGLAGLVRTTRAAAACGSHSYAGAMSPAPVRHADGVDALPADLTPDDIAARPVLLSRRDLLDPDLTV